MPDGRLHDGERVTRVHDLLVEPGHTGWWLTAGEGVSDALARRLRETLILHVVAAEAQAGVAGWADPGGALHRVLGARRPTLYVVRPDGYVGLVVAPPDGGAVAAYFTRLASGGARTAS
jgi:hypothetical protein